MNVGEHFVHLTAEHGGVGRLQVLTRDVAVAPDGQNILVGIDERGHRHLLIPTPPESKLTPFAHKVISVTKRPLSNAADDIHYLDVACSDPKLFLVFDRLAEEIVSRVLKQDADPILACLNTLDEWRAIIETASQPISSTTAAGLVGELSLLETLAAVDAHSALLSWKGPDASTHDFVNAVNSAIEVKASTSIEGKTVSISGLDQLDQSSRRHLHLAVYHLRESPDAPNLDERIDRLIRLGVSRIELIKKVAKAGYVYESGSNSDGRYECVSFRVWEVTSEFPGLRRSELDEFHTSGVENVKYTVTLDTAPAPLVADKTSDLLANWMPSE